MDKQLRILILEDSVDDVELIEYQLKKGEFSYTSLVVETRDDYERALSEFKPEVILSDHSLPMFDSMLALQIFHSYRKIFNPAAVFILVTGTVSEEFAVQIMRNGADDYILKDRLKRLPGAVLNAWERNRLKEQQRREQEEKLYLFNILQKSLHEIYLINPGNFHFVYANEEASKNLGYSPDEFQAMSPAETIEGFNDENFRQIIKLTEKRRKGLLLERKAIRKNGSTYPVQIHLEVIGQGRKKRILANVLDITEAKELEEQKELLGFIQNSFGYEKDLEESLEIILKEFSESCSLIAAEAYSRQFNQPGSKLLASYNFPQDKGSVLGSHLAEKVYESKTTEKCLVSTNHVNREDWLKTAKINSAMAIPLELGGEIVAVLVGYFKQEKDLEKKLSGEVRSKLAVNIKRKKTEEELQKIFDFTPDILMVLGKDGYIRKVNPALHKILGYTAEKMFSNSFEIYLHPDDKPVVEKWRNRNLERNEVDHYETRWRARNGEYKWFSWAVTPYLKGELHFVVGRDITQSKQQMNAIKEQNRKLAEIAWEQSHVVRAPLTRLLACVEYLEEDHDKPNEILSSVKHSAYEIDKVIKDIIGKSEKVELNGKG